MYIQSFKELKVWQRAIELVQLIYKLTEKLPQSEIYLMTNQMRRAAVSIPCNIAEGKKRRTRKDFINFLRIADGSAAELETQIIILNKLYPHVQCKEASQSLEETQKMLTSMIKKLESGPIHPKS